MGSERPKSKCSIVFIFEGREKKGDVCFNCGKQLRDKIESMKESKR